MTSFKETDQFYGDWIFCSFQGSCYQGWWWMTVVFFLFLGGQQAEGPRQARGESRGQIGLPGIQSRVPPPQRHRSRTNQIHPIQGRHLDRGGPAAGAWALGTPNPHFKFLKRTKSPAKHTRRNLPAFFPIEKNSNWVTDIVQLFSRAFFLSPWLARDVFDLYGFFPEFKIDFFLFLVVVLSRFLFLFMF